MTSATPKSSIGNFVSNFQILKDNMAASTGEVSSSEALDLVVEATKTNKTFTEMENAAISGSQPYLEICEQPQSRGYRFRYECEGPSHGGIPGANSIRGHKSYPTVRIVNYNGPARIMATLVTERYHRLHAHKLVHNKYGRNGICVMEIKGGEMKFMFPNLGVTHITKRKLKEVLELRVCELLKCERLIKFGDLDGDCQLSDGEIQYAKTFAAKICSNMALNVVCLSFQAYLPDSMGNFTRMLEPVFSNPIFDNKAPGACTLKICRMDRYSCHCTGNVEVFLLCEKVQKDDISVVFIERDDEGNVVWEDIGNFGPSDVHRQYAIVFRTPPYRDMNITKSVHVTIQLRRQTDGEMSEPHSWTYFPQPDPQDSVKRTQMKQLPSEIDREYPWDRPKRHKTMGYHDLLNAFV